MRTNQNKLSTARKTAVVVFLFFVVAAINLPRVPQFVGFTVVGWAAGGALLLTALVLAFSNYRTHTKTNASK